MSSRQSSPLIDLAAVGDRLRRWRQWQQLSQAALARRAEVDSMVIARLEQQHKPRLEVETAAKLAHVLGWTLDQFCGLAPAPDIPDVPPPRPYNPLEDGRPAWLPDHVATSRVDRQLAASITAWRVRGATWPRIAEALTAWGIRPFGGGQRWTIGRVQFCPRSYTRDVKAQQVALLREYGFADEARQLARQRGRR